MEVLFRCNLPRVVDSAKRTMSPSIGWFDYPTTALELHQLYGPTSGCKWFKNTEGVYTVPNQANILDASYNPLSRPLYMQLYNNDTSLAWSKPLVQFGLSNRRTALTDATSYDGLPLDTRMAQLARLGLPLPTIQSLCHHPLLLFPLKK